jgi:hypothetical protein
VSTGAKEDESSTGYIWAAGFHHVTTCSCLVGVLKLNELLISLIFKFFSHHGELWITETIDTESADMGA